MSLSLLCAACSGGSPTAASPAPPPAQPAPAPPINHPPTISDVVIPSFGVSGLTSLTFSADGHDEDGDDIAFLWRLPGQDVAAKSVTSTLLGDGAVPVTVTATDARGASSSVTGSVTIGSMTGQWNLRPSGACPPFGVGTPPVLSLVQTGGSVDGTLASPGGWCRVAGGTTGRVVTAVAHTIDAGGLLLIRTTVGAFDDIVLQGRMDTSGRAIAGNMFAIDGTFVTTFTMEKR